MRYGVAKKYEVEFGTTFFVEEFENKLNKLKDLSKYEDIVVWDSEYHEDYELNKELLEKAKDDVNLPKELRKFAEEIIDSCDPDLDYVRIELF